MKNKKWIILCILIVLALIGVGIYFYYNSNKADTNNYDAQRTATNDNSSNNENNTDNSNSENTSDQNTTQENNITNNTTEIKRGITTEQTIRSFSTKIYSKDSARQNNINITCSTLNGTVVANGSTFSFCNTVGQSTSNKGYLEADIFDRNGNKKKGYGGGNCQVSTTLYNAVLAVPSLVVTERHEHSNKVPYIQTGKDAAVAYGSYDLKFRNDSGYDIKIYVEASTSNVTVRLVRLV